MRMLHQLHIRSRIRERVAQYRFLFSNHSRHVPCYRINQNSSGDFPAGEDKVSDGNLRCRQMLDDAFVDTLVAAADQNHLVCLREPQRFGLIELPAGRAEHDHFRLRALANRLDRIKNRFRLEDHSFAAAERPVVHRSMAIGSEIPQIVHLDLNQSTFFAAANDTEIKRPSEELRKDRYDIKPEGHLIDQFSIPKSQFSSEEKSATSTVPF